MMEHKEKYETVTTYSRCRMCGSERITEILDFGKLALAGGFEKDIKSAENSIKYPLRLYLCDECLIVSVKDIVKGEVLFKDYYYASSVSQTLRNHFEELAGKIEDIVNISNTTPTVLEIGCNDGVLLNQLPRHYKKIGVDPSSVTREYKKRVENDTSFDIRDTFFNDSLDLPTVDLITSSNCMAHIEDMNTIFKGVVKYLCSKGVLIIEVHSLKVLIEEMNWDMIYSEHMTYYSVTSLSKLLARHGLYVYDAEKIPIHGGSIRIYASKEEKKSTNVLKEILKSEVELGNVEYYRSFQKQIYDNGERLRELLEELKNKGVKTIPYGASGRANTVMGVYNLTREILGDVIIDDSPVKSGMYTPWNGLKIISSDVLREKRDISHILLFAWTYKNEISKKYPNYKFINPITSEIE